MKKLTARQYALAVDQVLHQASAPAAADVAARLLERLRRDRTQRLSSRITDHLRTLDAARRGQGRAIIEGPTSAQASAVAKQLKHIDASIVVDPSLKRGIAVTIDDRRFDLTLTGRLQQLRRSLLSS